MFGNVIKYGISTIHNTMVRIRKATRKDLKHIAKLMLSEFSKRPFNETVSLKAALKSLEFYLKIGKAHIAVIDNAIVGAVVFKIEQYWEGPVLIAEDLAVKQEFKKQGVGKQLIDSIEKYAKKNKIKSIQFLTNSKSDAVKFYKKQGYSISKNAVLMSKKLR